MQLETYSHHRNLDDNWRIRVGKFAMTLFIMVLMIGTPVAGLFTLIKLNDLFKPQQTQTEKGNQSK
jgi:uncharacterized membrane protein